MSAETKEAEHTRVELRQEGQVAVVRFTTPSGINVICSELIGELGNAVEKIAACPEVRFAVFRGSGRTFLAGADIREMSRMDEDDAKTFSRHGHHVFDAIEALPQVSIAAINGHAMGGGCELAMACDFRIMVAGAKIGQPEVKLGLIPGWGGTKRLPRLVGWAQAKRLMFTGEPLDAAAAERFGLVDQVVEDEAALDAAVREWFKQLASASPAAIKRLKHALAAGDEVEQFSRCFGCSDAREGMEAFLAKRAPSWSNWADCRSG